MIAKQQIRINYVEEISLKCDAKKIKYYERLKTPLLGFGQFSGRNHKTTN